MFPSRFDYVAATSVDEAVAAKAARGGETRLPAGGQGPPRMRERGTMCGSVSPCDPEGDWNSVLLATGADVIARGPKGERVIPISDFVVDLFTNSLNDDEMVTEVRIPVPARRSGGAYLKLERKIGDYATAAVAAHLELADDGTIANAG